MTAKFEITITFNIVQEVDNPTELLDMHDVANTAANFMADALTDFNAVMTYDFKEGKMDAK